MVPGFYKELVGLHKAQIPILNGLGGAAPLEFFKEPGEAAFSVE